jgi:cytochrome c-type biogenesis protein CcmH/NrfF
MNLRVGTSRAALLLLLAGSVVAAGVLAVTLPATPAAAQEAGQVTDQAPPTVAALTEQQVNETTLRLSVKYMSPYCPGSSLRDCGSGNAATLREEIRTWVREGRTEEWITAELISRYGESILSAPRFKGFNILVWIFPIIALLVGLGVILAYLQRQQRVTLDSRTPVREVPDDHRDDPELERALEKEVSARLR